MSTGPTSAETTALLLESPRRLSVDEHHRMIALYARFRVPEYWVVDVVGATIEVFTEPRPRSGIYSGVRTVGKRDTLVSEGMPEVSVRVRDLF